MGEERREKKEYHVVPEYATGAKNKATKSTATVAVTTAFVLLRMA
ncbi:MAG TPA: hypothetical protein VMS77_03385 [Conexivisphaerales archaeon]|nr:hypothetical protein [Conexivisphaerales archaeon]